MIYFFIAQLSFYQNSTIWLIKSNFTLPSELFSIKWVIADKIDRSLMRNSQCSLTRNFHPTHPIPSLPLNSIIYSIPFPFQFSPFLLNPANGLYCQTILCSQRVFNCLIPLISSPKRLVLFFCVSLVHSLLSRIVMTKVTSFCPIHPFPPLPVLLRLPHCADHVPHGSHFGSYRVGQVGANIQTHPKEYLSPDWSNCSKYSLTR